MEPFPEDVRQFMAANIESLVQLEILRLLAADQDRTWDAASLAPEVQAQPQKTARDLAALYRRGLITALPGPASCYQYGPQGPLLEAEVAELLQLYNERPVTVIRMIYSGDHLALNHLADRV